MAAACCWSRGGGGILPPSADSPFDKELLDGFRRALEAKSVMRSSPSDIQRRRLEGSLGLSAQFSGAHFGKKRKGECDGSAKVVLEVDPEAFNFTKANAAERIMEVEAFPAGYASAGLTLVLANVSPLAFGHVLFVPNCDQVLPQVLTEEHFLLGLHLLGMSTRHDFRLLYNSILAFASVNHFHLHGMYLDYCGLPDKRFPIEKVDRSIIAGGITEGRVAVELLVETQWYVRGFVLSAGCKVGTPGEHPAADLEALASLAARVVRELLKRDIPHNILITPPVERKQKRIQSIMAHEVEAKPNAVSPEVYVLPRRPAGELREAAGFNAAVLEMAGIIVAHSEEAFASLAEESLKEVFKTDVSLPDSVIDELICKVAWLPS